MKDIESDLSRGLRDKLAPQCIERQGEGKMCRVRILSIPTINLLISMAYDRKR